MTPPSLRNADASDTDKIANIYNQYVGSGPYTMESVAWTAGTVKEKMDAMSSREVWLVAVDDSAVVGWGQLKNYSPREGYRVCCEVSLYLDRETTGRGIGNALMKRLVDEAERLEYWHIVSKIISANEGSIRFHHRHGFETVGVQRRIGIVDGQPADVTILQRIFD